MFKAQFMPSKRMPGGAEGVARLCAAVDVGEALTLRRVDLASLRDPDLAPEVADPPKVSSIRERLAVHACAAESKAGLRVCAAAAEAQAPATREAPVGVATVLAGQSCRR